MIFTTLHKNSQDGQDQKQVNNVLKINNMTVGEFCGQEMSGNIWERTIWTTATIFRLLN